MIKITDPETPKEILERMEIDLSYLRDAIRGSFGSNPSTADKKILFKALKEIIEAEATIARLQLLLY